jgi:hypothetical protein
MNKMTGVIGVFTDDFFLEKWVCEVSDVVKDQGQDNCC